jgi:hypothetical protein
VQGNGNVSPQGLTRSVIDFFQVRSFQQRVC